MFKITHEELHDSVGYVYSQVLSTAGSNSSRMIL